MNTHAIPSHIPEHLVWNHSYEAFLQELDNPFMAACRLHDGPGAIYATHAQSGKPAWIFTRHELIREAFADHERFSNRRGRLVGAVMDPTWLLLPVESDPPNHRDYRNILLPLFSPAASARLTDSVTDLCHRLIARFEDKGGCEFVSEFASILPNSIVISLLGLPGDMLDQFVSWEQTIIHGTDNEERLAASLAVINHLKSFVAEQKKAPTSELMQSLLAGKVQGRALNDAEILGFYYLLYVAGLDTVANTLSCIMWQLSVDQALQDRLRDSPGRIPDAIQEFTRAFGVSAPSRVVARDCTFHGVTLKEGDDVILPTILAGRDPRVFRDPHRIDIDRKAQHVTFGNGAHVCIGAPLAKREMAVTLEAFLARFRNIRLDDRQDLQFVTKSTLGLKRLHLKWDKV